jgi:isochorismate synthase
LEAFLEKLEVQLAKQLPFVLYRKPDEKNVHAILQGNDALHFVADYSESGFVFAPFDGKRPAVLMPLDEKISIDQPSKPRATPIPKTKPYEQDSHRAAHIALVNKAKSVIDGGGLDKLVISRALKLPNATPPLQLFLSLIDRYASAFCYLWFHPKIGMWLGATPEILLQLQNDRFTTMSLAGTQIAPRPEKPDWGRKELEEQAMVTEYIKRVLADQVTDLKVFGLESVLAGNLWHLRTKITGRLNKDLKELIQAMHPTPAVCGLPMEEAKKFILQNEGYDRAYYTGYLGELNMVHEKWRAPNGKNIENSAYRSLQPMTALYVNLRCMQLTSNEAIIYVGGGITKDSNPEKEWEETVNKSLTMIKILSET